MKQRLLYVCPLFENKHRVINVMVGKTTFLFYFIFPERETESYLSGKKKKSLNRKITLVFSSFNILLHYLIS